MLYRYLKLCLFIGAGLWMSCSNVEDSETGGNTGTGTPDDETVAGDTPAWKNFVSGSEENVLLDFSYAGYDHGESEPADIYNLGYKIYDVTKYGAIPDDGKSDRQAFIDAVTAALGGTSEKEMWTFGSRQYSTKPVENARAIIYFPPGEYIIYDKETDAMDADGNIDPENGKSYSLEIRAGHFIIAGAGKDRTVVTMADPYEPISGDRYDYPEPLLSLKNWTGLNDPLCEVTGSAEKGSFEVEVSSTAGLSEDMWVALRMQNSDPEVVAAELAPYDADPEWTGIINSGVQVEDMHQIASVKGNTVRFKEPIMHAVDPDWGWEIYKFTCYEEVGVEDITFKGHAAEVFEHSVWSENDAYSIITMMRIANGWVRRCDFQSVSAAVKFSSCANVSAYDIDIYGNKGHHAVYTSTASRAFIGKVTDRSEYAGIQNYGQHHSVGVSKPSMGTVLWRCEWGTQTNFEAHATQPRATLYDCCRGGFLLGHAGGADSELPNHLDDLTLWNFEALSATQTDNLKWWDTSKYWTILPPTIVGFHGVGITFDQSQVKLDESHGTAVTPQSLYEAQLERRLGSLPRWLDDLKY